ncbi:unnamed protein product [Spirodela intermedia]|uniref:cinnamyl-alcohol dehydrogenase n=1 Tax=Spirodela intermedia TaxID=51605 RepID=A0A7I8IL03_SPIIN|nr:unnamed protein product [Spirodela intermedia]CAA6657822.1 unnamed protein product [Spirodela intermedia]
MEKVPEEHRRKTFGLAAKDASGILSPFSFSRRNNGDEDITLKILFCGICHSDLHCIKNEWRNAVYQSHEIVGVVTEVGRNVSKFKLGDRAGVGCMVGSCRSCGSCKQGFENYCPQMVLTYNSVDGDGTMTYGGYSDAVVPAIGQGAPLLCAGITVYSPMKHFGLNEPGKHLGVVGLGGLGHVAVKFAKAFGMKVTVISSSPSKEKEAMERLGADAFLVSSSMDQILAATGTMDGIINTVSATHPLMPLLILLKTHGKMIMVGAPEKPLEVPAFSLILGMEDTQEMLDFAGKHGITADVEVIRMDYVNTAMERLARNDVRYRFVIDVPTP